MHTVHEMQPIAADVARVMVCVSVCFSVCDGHTGELNKSS